MKINIVLLSMDSDYSGKIFDYAKYSYGEIIDMCCVKLDNGIEEMNNTDFQVALIDKNSIEDLTAISEKDLGIYRNFINLANEFGIKIIDIVEKYDDIDGRSVFKFQKLNKFFEKIFEILSSDSGFSFLSEKDDCGFEKMKIIAFTSFDGSKCEKNALEYCDKKVNNGESVVFMSLNPFSYCGEVGKLSFTDILLAVKSRHANSKNVIREAIISGENGVEKFPEFDNAADFVELSEENILKLIQALDGMDKFRYLVIDVPIYNLMKFTSVYEKLDKLIIVESGYGTQKEVERGKEYIEYQNRYVKVVSVLWMKTGETINALWEKEKAL